MLWRGRRGPVAAVQYSHVGLAREVARRSRSRIGSWLWLLPLLAAALMIVGLARPQRGHSRTEVTANGIDIVLALDVSGSMQALDFLIDNQRVNRIEVVKSVVSRFIDERPNDRIGLIAFAGSPYLVSPVTLDHDWLQQNLERVTIGQADDGTAIGSAIAASVNRLRRHTREIQGGGAAHGRREQHRQNIPAGRGGSRQGPRHPDLHHRRGRSRQGADPGPGRGRQSAHHHGQGRRGREDAADHCRRDRRQVLPRHRHGFAARRSTSRSINSRRPPRPCRSSSTTTSSTPGHWSPRLRCWGSATLLQHTRYRRLP